MTTASPPKPGCLTAFLHFFRKPTSADTPPEQLDPTIPLPYRLRDDFLSMAEISIYHVLVTITRDRMVVCPKVGLQDLFFIATRTDFHAFLNRIARKHVDFLLCQPHTMRPLIGIELDDRSHQQAQRQERDAFVDQVFAAAQIPLLRIPARQSYNTFELTALLAPYLDNAASFPITETNPHPKAGQTTTAASVIVPICPKCGIEMVLRTASRGANQGGQFYGCVNYPRCRELRPYLPPP